MRKTKNIEKAKVEAVKEWLMFYLKFDNDDISEMKINATQIATKGNIIYVAFNDRDTIKDLHKRAAECRNDEVILRNYIPPQYYEQYMTISAMCADMIKTNNYLKTQMRFAHGGYTSFN